MCEVGQGQGVGKWNPGDAQEATGTAFGSGPLPFLPVLNVGVRFLVRHYLAKLSNFAVRASWACREDHPSSRYYEVHGVISKDSAHSAWVKA